MQTLQVVAAVIEFEGKYLCTKRGPGGPSEFKWEFPGGKIEEGESHEEALIREIKEELDMTIVPIAPLLSVQHGYPDFKIMLHSYICHVNSADYTLREHVEAQWLCGDKLKNLQWAPADVPIVNLIENSKRPMD